MRENIERKYVVPVSRIYLYYIWIPAIFAILLLGGCSYNSDREDRVSPSAVQGVLDLRGWDFVKDGAVELEGEWDFYWNQLLTADQAASAGHGSGSPAADWLRLSRSWNGHVVDGQPIPGKGYATYHLKVTTDLTGDVLALELPTIRSSYSIWINGEQLGGAGTVGTSPETAQARYLPQLVYFSPDSPVLDIMLQVSNYDHRLGGIWNDLKLGEARQLTSHHQFHLGVELTLVGSLLVMGLYHLGLFLIRFKDKGSLYFALFCLAIGIRAMLVGEGAAYQLLPFISYDTGLRVEYLCYYIALPLAVMFCRTLFPQEISPLFVLGLQAAGGLFSLTVLLLSPYAFSYTTQWYQAITLLVCAYVMSGIVKALAKGKEGAGFAMFGGMFFIITVTIDILYYNEWIQIGNVSSIGLFFFIFMTSFIISLKSFKAFASVETLSRQLRELNMGLEHRIKERTAELERSNRSLEKMNEELGRLENSRRHLLSNISHDLGTPMTLIQGYVEALIDRVVVEPDQQEKYLRLILGRITGLNRLIADLFQLSKLEARQIDFSMQEMMVEDVAAYYTDRYDLEVNNAGLRFSVHAPAAPYGGSVFIDIDRIDQVLTNLIYNAIKHTPVGGFIQLQIAVDGSSIVMRVQDNGSGIDPDDLPYIFDRFYKKDKSRNSAGGGSGLGLAIAKEIVEFHGGRIWAESRLGQGACICFALPLQMSRQLLHS
ncbi:sensor histidine kinase [Paenibacillus sp. NPDC056579]|uniref:sensor histidine kinase n=1 Tax=unclassified Paenibacillus TaxID=185978 RepID=UPI001EF86B5F|nr:ATP-binding protein [Paenibacillus sp. H1-7]ULL13228.1 histidine kinase [Paenibacillus sp. H1-7]